MIETKTSRGFVLIELLVVISIIGMLSSMAFVAYSQARMKANDAALVVNIQSISKAMELYYADHGYYPYLQDTSTQHTTIILLADPTYCPSCLALRWDASLGDPNSSNSLTPYITENSSTVRKGTAIQIALVNQLHNHNDRNGIQIGPNGECRMVFNGYFILAPLQQANSSLLQGSPGIYYPSNAYDVWGGSFLAGRTPPITNCQE